MSIGAADFGAGVAAPARYRSLQTLLLLMVLGSLIGSAWLLPTRVERVVAATDRGDQLVLSRELQRAAQVASEPAEARALADIALTLGEPGLAAQILERSIAYRPDNIGALRLLLEIERQRHRMDQVAAVDEQLYAKTGELGALREAADIYASLDKGLQRTGALRRLAEAHAATASDIVELANRLNVVSDGRDALSVTMSWLDRASSLPSDVVALAVGLSVDEPEASVIASRLGAIIGTVGQDGPFHVLVQTYAERGKSELSLVAGKALGAAMLARSSVALLMAQLEVSSGDLSAARSRLDTLSHHESLTPDALDQLVDLDLRVGDIGQAFIRISKLQLKSLNEGLQHRLIEEAYKASRLDLLATVSLEDVAGLPPGIGAIVALARNDRPRAAALAAAALQTNQQLTGLGPSFVWALRMLGLQHQGVVRLLSDTRSGEINENELALLFELIPTASADTAAILATLRSQRETNSHAAAAWAILASQQSKSREVSTWLRQNSYRLPTSALIDLLFGANSRMDRALASAAGDGLADRTDLPGGFTPAAVSFLSHAADSLTPDRIQVGLQLIGSIEVSDRARGQIVSAMANRRNLADAVAHYRTSSFDKAALAWLARDPETGEPREAVSARFSLLGSIAPQQVVESISKLCASGCADLLPVYAAALLQDHRVEDAKAVLETGLQRLPPERRDAFLYDVMSRVPRESQLPLLRIGAQSGRADWRAALDEALTQAGRVDEVRAELRAEAKLPDLDKGRRQAIAARLVELGDRQGAIIVLKSIASGLPPQDPAVRSLIFLWGPRGEQAAVDWVRDQATAAMPADLPRWLEHLSYLGAPQAVIDIVERTPGVLTEGMVVKSYAAALQIARKQTRLDLLVPAQEAVEADALIAIGQLALDSGQQLAAWFASTRALEKATSNPTALLLAAESAAMLHRSEEAAFYYTKLLALDLQDVSVMTDAAESMLMVKKQKAARSTLVSALSRSPAVPTTLSSARSKARVLLLLGRRSEAMSLLEAWLLQYPAHAGLQADLLQARTQLQ